MKEILYPTDFSDASKAAYHYAFDIAQHLDAELTLFHVGESLSLDAKTPGDMREKIISENEEEVLQQLKRIPPEGIAEKPFMKYIAAEGKTVDAINKYAKEHEVEFVVMGTHGSGGLKEYFVGSNTASVIAHAPCSVVAVPDRASFKEIKKVVLAADYKMYNALELHHLHHFLKAFDADIHIVHVLKKNDEKVPDRQEQEKMVNEFYDPEKVTFKLLDADDRYEAIRDYSENISADLICLKHHDHSFWDELFNKNLTKRMAMHTKIPLLAFR